VRDIIRRAFIATGWIKPGERLSEGQIRYARGVMEQALTAQLSRDAAEVVERTAPAAALRRGATK
jgi:hypothetical protein